MNFLSCIHLHKCTGSFNGNQTVFYHLHISHNLKKNCAIPFRLLLTETVMYYSNFAKHYKNTTQSSLILNLFLLKKITYIKDTTPQLTLLKKSNAKKTFSLFYLHKQYHCKRFSPIRYKRESNRLRTSCSWSHSF